MKIGVVSDTHNNIKNVGSIIRLFNEAGVEHVFHTGDITRPATLELFKKLNVALSGVYGNNDVELDGLDQVSKKYAFQFTQPPLRVTFADRNIVIVHDPRDLSEELICNADLALHGHTHMLRVERHESRLFFNPGECAGHMKGLNAIGIVDLNTMESGLIKF